MDNLEFGHNLGRAIKNLQDIWDSWSRFEMLEQSAPNLAKLRQTVDLCTTILPMVNRLGLVNSIVERFPDWSISQPDPNALDLVVTARNGATHSQGVRMACLLAAEGLDLFTVVTEGGQRIEPPAFGRDFYLLLSTEYGTRFRVSIDRYYVRFWPKADPRIETLEQAQAFAAEVQRKYPAFVPVIYYGDGEKYVFTNN